MKNKWLWGLRSRIAELENIFANDRNPKRADDFYKALAECLAIINDRLKGGK